MLFMTTFDKLYINGSWVASDSTETIDVIDSVTEEVMATVPAGTPADVDAAVAAAKAAFPAWSTTPVEERAKYLDAHWRRTRRPHGRNRHRHLEGDRHGEVAVAARAGWPPHQQLQPGGRGGRELRVRGIERQLADRSRADRRGRLHHPVELPAPSDRRKGSPTHWLRDARSC